MVWLHDSEKIEDMFIHFDTIHERDGHTHTDRQTDRHRMTAKVALVEHRASKNREMCILHLYSTHP